MTTVARGDDRPAAPSMAGAATRVAAVVCTGLTYRFGDHVAADTYCDRVALMHQGTIRAEGTPAVLKAALGSEATLDEVFRHYTGHILDHEPGGIRDVRRARRTARRLG